MSLDAILGEVTKSNVCQTNDDTLQRCAVSTVNTFTIASDILLSLIATASSKQTFEKQRRGYSSGDLCHDIRRCRHYVPLRWPQCIAYRKLLCAMKRSLKMQYISICWRSLVLEEPRTLYATVSLGHEASSVICHPELDLLKLDALQKMVHIVEMI